MSAQGDAQPIIIKRKKKGGGHGHHGGAWKVAYADFVTAMMAFFMLMWLLNATSEQQRKGLADYFTPSVAINRSSGGGDGAFGGDSVFTEETLAQSGNGATLENPTEADKARGETGASAEGDKTDAEDEALKSLEEKLVGKSGESTLDENDLQHINTRVTDEGLVIEVSALPGRPIFEADGETPTILLTKIAGVIAETFILVENGVAIGGHVAKQPIVVAESTVWEMSAAQATSARRLLENVGLSPSRIERVTGHADREIKQEDPLSIRNNRLEIVLLRAQDP